MTQRIHFISDLHLCHSKPEITEAFVERYLANLSSDVSALYILGDLFDVWVGDDDESDPIPAVRDALNRVSAAGTAIYLIVGNRDFLMGEAFSQKFQITLLPDHQVIDLFGTPTLLMHGDLLCTDDVNYQKFREVSHSAAWRDQFLSQSLDDRKTLAQNYRAESADHKGAMDEEIMDVNPNAVRDTMRQHGVTRLIHGHTHRPAVHDLTVDGQKAQRFVLAEWHAQGSVLEWTDQGYQVLTI